MTDIYDLKQLDLAVAAIAPDLTELEQLSLKVAVMDGWTNIRHLDTSRNQEIQPKKRVFVGKNSRKELGTNIPDYANDLTAIAQVFDRLYLYWEADSDGYARDSHEQDGYGYHEETPAIALCKLLILLRTQ